MPTTAVDALMDAVIADDAPAALEAGRRVIQAKLDEGASIESAFAWALYIVTEAPRRAPLEAAFNPSWSTPT